MPNAEKILSLYDGDLHVMNRSKASGEFGNALFLCEQSDGLIVDYKLTRATAFAARFRAVYGSICAAFVITTGDIVRSLQKKRPFWDRLYVFGSPDV